MAKLELNPAPIFPGKVDIPVPGKEPAQVVFTFKHRTRDGLNAWMLAGASRPDVDTILEAAEGWDLPQPFNRENVETLVQNYIGSPKVIVDRYINELTRAKLGN